jgi:CheY-like chemotaxis protein
MDGWNRSAIVLMADDDSEDRVLARDAMRECRPSIDFRAVVNGAELMDYLYQRGEYADPDAAPCPDLILLDLNMPRKTGREALMEIKVDRDLGTIPVVVLTTSRADEDAFAEYKLGANSCLIKPMTFEGLVGSMDSLATYWFETAKMPPPEPGGRHG